MVFPRLDHDQGFRSRRRLFFQKSVRKELLTYMKDLCLSPDDLLPESADAVLIEEWQDFARGLISSCTGSKAYCSTLFGFVPIKDAKGGGKARRRDPSGDQGLSGSL